MSAGKLELSCWKCQKELDLPNASSGQVAFSAVCDHCGVWLHCCRNCRFYKPGMANDCLIPETDPIKDREQRNFCDEFKIQTQREAQSGPDVNAIGRSLFGDASEEIKPKNIDDLFKD